MKVKDRKKVWSRPFAVLVLIGILSSFMTGCSNGNKEDDVVVTVGESSVRMDEVIWYLYLSESELKDDAKEYFETNKASYWDVAYDDANSVGDMVKSNVISMAIRYEVLSDQAKKTKSYDIKDDGGYEKQAKEKMKEISSELKKKGLTKEGYVKVLEKTALAKLYYEDAIELYKVDEDSVRKENPYDSTTYDSKEAYENYIESLIEQKRQEMFETEYDELVKRYDTNINEKVWDQVKVGDLANLMK